MSPSVRLNRVGCTADVALIQMRYMLSVAGNYNFLEFISNAKSGEFFFFSHDERFMIKTMKASSGAVRVIRT